MHISEIHYVESQSIETYNGHGLKEWNKKEYAVTVSLKEDDDENKADELAKQFVKEKLAKHQFTTEMQSPEPAILPIIQERKVTPGMQYVLDKINSATTVEILERVRTKADMNPALKSVFDEQMKKLKP